MKRRTGLLAEQLELRLVLAALGGFPRGTVEEPAPPDTAPDSESDTVEPAANDPPVAAEESVASSESSEEAVGVSASSTRSASATPTSTTTVQATGESSAQIAKESASGAADSGASIRKTDDSSVGSDDRDETSETIPRGTRTSPPRIDADLETTRPDPLNDQPSESADADNADGIVVDSKELPHTPPRLVSGLGQASAIPLTPSVTTVCVSGATAKQEFRGFTVEQTVSCHVASTLEVTTAAQGDAVGENWIRTLANSMLDWLGLSGFSGHDQKLAATEGWTWAALVGLVPFLARPKGDAAKGNASTDATGDWWAALPLRGVRGIDRRRAHRGLVAKTGATRRSGSTTNAPAQCSSHLSEPDISEAFAMSLMETVSPEAFVLSPLGPTDEHDDVPPEEQSSGWPLVATGAALGTSAAAGAAVVRQRTAMRSRPTRPVMRFTGTTLARPVSSKPFLK